MVKAKHRKKYIVLPISLAIFNIGQEIAVYKCQAIKNPYIESAVLLLLSLFGFVFVGFFFSPYVVKTIEHLYLSSKKNAGKLGELFILTVILAILFYCYFQIYTVPGGVENIIPKQFHH